VLARQFALRIVASGAYHPSGDLEPSTEDRETLERLSKASVILGIQLLDFLVVSRNRYGRIDARGGIVEEGEFPAGKEV